MLNDIPIIVRKKQIKNLNLRINEQGTVKLSVPIGCSEKRVSEFLKSKEEWIKKHVAKRKTEPLLTRTILQDIEKKELTLQMQQLIPDLIKKWEPIIGVQVNEYCFKAMSSRWGSCHIHKKRITLNLYLMRKPFACLEYVLVHEMVHLLEASHNQRFHALMDKFMPNWPGHKKRLTQV